MCLNNLAKLSMEQNYLDDVMHFQNFGRFLLSRKHGIISRIQAICSSRYEQHVRVQITKVGFVRHSMHREGTALGHSLRYVNIWNTKSGNTDFLEEMRYTYCWIPLLKMDTKINVTGSTSWWKVTKCLVKHCQQLSWMLDWCKIYTALYSTSSVLQYWEK